MPRAALADPLRSGHKDAMASGALVRKVAARATRGWEVMPGSYQGDVTGSMGAGGVVGPTDDYRRT